MTSLHEGRGRLGLLVHRMGEARSGNVLIVVSSAASALTGLLVVAGAARTQTSEQLAHFSLIQLVVVTLVNISRASVFNPALAAQRRTGRSFVPATWAIVVGTMASVVVAGFVAFSTDSTPAALLSGGVAGLALVQDGLRAALASREDVRWMVVSDATTFVVVACAFLVPGQPPTASSGLLRWGVGISAGCIVSLFALWFRRRGVNLSPQRFRHVWPLGRWALVEAVLAGVVTVLPFVTATWQLGSEVGGTYRVMQTALARRFHGGE